MAVFPGPFGSISLPDARPPSVAETDYGALQPLMNWAVSLQAAFEQTPEKPHASFQKLVAYGLLHPEYDGVSGLGVILYCDAADQPRGVTGVRVGDFEFPVVIRSVQSESLNTSHVPGLNGATRTCWAHSRRPGVGEGFLTAKHVLGPFPRPGMQVPLRGGGYSRLIDLAPECFDVALLSHPVAAARPMTTSWNIALTQTVEVDGEASGITPASVTALTDPRGSWSGARPLSALALRFLVSFTGQPGDSGALVHSPPYGPGDGLGIYLGSFRHAGSGGFSEGYCQHLEQVRQLMELDLFLL